MNLKITDDEELGVSMDSNDYVVPPHSLKFNAVHLFVASQKWEVLKIKLTSEIPLDILKHIRKKVDSVECVVMEDNDKTMNLMCELYPEMSGKIRKQYLKGRPLNELLL